jgi:hypothetical protein
MRILKDLGVRVSGVLGADKARRGNTQREQYHVLIILSIETEGEEGPLQKAGAMTALKMESRARRHG